MLLEEAVRQHCIIAAPVAGTFSKPVAGGADSNAVWWHYIERVVDSCPFGSGAATDATSVALQACTVRVMKELAISKPLVDACMEERGLLFLEDDREARAWGGRSAMAIRI